MAQAGPKDTPPQSTPARPAKASSNPPPASGTTDPAVVTTDPAATAVRAAARDAEIRRLTEQRDELRKLVGEAPTLAMLRAEVDALQQIAARTGASRSRRFTLSAGVASDLEVSGFSVDPATGDAYVRDGDQVTVTSRTGETRTVDMPAPSGGGESTDTK
ncbi:MAG TPA: hypothetical protein VGD43_20545 [Micromonospora sp.]